MRSTLTVITAIAVILSFGVTSAYAETEVWSCTNKKGTLKRLVYDPQECGTGEIAKKWFSDADFVRIYSDGTIFHPHSGTEYGSPADPDVFVNCRLEDEDGYYIYFYRLIPGEVRTICGETGAVQETLTNPFVHGATCVDVITGLLEPPAVVSTRCQIEDIWRTGTSAPY